MDSFRNPHLKFPNYLNYQSQPNVPIISYNHLKVNKYKPIVISQYNLTLLSNQNCLRSNQSKPNFGLLWVTLVYIWLVLDEFGFGFLWVDFGLVLDDFALWVDFLGYFWLLLVTFGCFWLTFGWLLVDFLLTLVPFGSFWLLSVDFGLLWVDFLSFGWLWYFS